MTAGWQSCSCLDLNGKTQLDVESVALKWNCLLQAELGRGHRAAWARGAGRGRGRVCAEGTLWGALSYLGQGFSMCCHSGKGTSLLVFQCVQGTAASSRLLLSKPLPVWGALLALGVAGTGHWGSSDLVHEDDLPLLCLSGFGQISILSQAPSLRFKDVICASVVRKYLWGSWLGWSLVTGKMFGFLAADSPRENCFPLWGATLQYCPRSWEPWAVLGIFLIIVYRSKPWKWLVHRQDEAAGRQGSDLLWSPALPWLCHLATWLWTSPGDVYVHWIALCLGQKDDSDWTFLLNTVVFG